MESAARQQSGARRPEAPARRRTVQRWTGKGDQRIAVQSRDKLPGLIDTLVSAVQAGELDELLARSAKPVGGAKSRKAA